MHRASPGAWRERPPDGEPVLPRNGGPAPPRGGPAPPYGGGPAPPYGGLTPIRVGLLRLAGAHARSITCISGCPHGAGSDGDLVVPLGSLHSLEDPARPAPHGPRAVRPCTSVGEPARLDPPGSWAVRPCTSVGEPARLDPPGSGAVRPCITGGAPVRPDGTPLPLPFHKPQAEEMPSPTRRGGRTPPREPTKSRRIEPWH